MPTKRAQRLTRWGCYVRQLCRSDAAAGLLPIPTGKKHARSTTFPSVFFINSSSSNATPSLFNQHARLQSRHCQPLPPLLPRLPRVGCCLPAPCPCSGSFPCASSCVTFGLHRPSHRACSKTHTTIANMLNQRPHQTSMSAALPQHRSTSLPAPSLSESAQSSLPDFNPQSNPRRAYPSHLVPTLTFWSSSSCAFCAPRPRCHRHEPSACASAPCWHRCPRRRWPAASCRTCAAAAWQRTRRRWAARLQRPAASTGMSTVSKQYTQA